MGFDRHRSRVFLVLVLGLPGSGVASAQMQIRPESIRAELATPRTPMLPIARTIAEAEREGAGFPRGGPIDPLRLEMVSSGAMGSPDRRCVSPATAGGTRAGDFNFAMNPRGFTAGKPNKLWWIPLHDPSHERDILVIRGARIDSAATPADTSRFINRELVWPITADVQVNRSGAYFIGFEMPSQGTWLLVATSGSDWGCIIAQGIAPP